MSSGGTFFIGGDRDCIRLLASCSESSSKGVGGSDLKERDLVAVDGIELCVRRSADSLGGFGNGLRCDSEPPGVIEVFESSGGSEGKIGKLSLISRSNGIC